MKRLSLYLCPHVKNNFGNVGNIGIFQTLLKRQNVYS